MLKLIMPAAFVAFATSAAAEPIACQARVALNQIYDLTFDPDDGTMFVRNLAGTEFEGKATRYLSGRTGDTSFFLATGFNTGLEVRLVDAGANIALCLAASECYLCRR